MAFTTSAGEKISYPQNGFINYQVGDRVKVLYDPDNPTMVRDVDAPREQGGGSVS